MAKALPPGARRGFAQHVVDPKASPTSMCPPQGRTATSVAGASNGSWIGPPARPGSSVPEVAHMPCCTPDRLGDRPHLTHPAQGRPRLVLTRLLRPTGSTARRPPALLHRTDALIASASHRGDALPARLLAEAAALPSSTLLHLGWTVRLLAERDGYIAAAAQEVCLQLFGGPALAAQLDRASETFRQQPRTRVAQRGRRRTRSRPAFAHAEADPAADRPASEPDPAAADAPLAAAACRVAGAERSRGRGRRGGRGRGQRPREPRGTAVPPEPATEPECATGGTQRERGVVAAEVGLRAGLASLNDVSLEGTCRVRVFDAAGCAPTPARRIADCAANWPAPRHGRGFAAGARAGLEAFHACAPHAAVPCA